MGEGNKASLTKYSDLQDFVYWYSKRGKEKPQKVNILNYMNLLLSQKFELFFNISRKK